uniref:Uncharacterized protein n=1 Tax=Anguilla anguilla TaxID=7936 RepID=A0A0E9SDA8_ANGAN
MPNSIIHFCLHPQISSNAPCFHFFFYMRHLTSLFVSVSRKYIPMQCVL